MALEIERKFLLGSDAWRALARSRVLMRQGYLSSNNHSSIRVRIAGDDAWINLKAKRSTRTRLEFEYPIPRGDADEILHDLCSGPLVEKYRHEIVAGPHVWEIDEFLGDNAGLIVAEIELGSEDEPFDRPDWLGAEVTEDERYYNFNLAKHPYREWK
ncbi:MAG: CYTH domain-containing protein [Steroidobacteraceae bacterium]